jgi:hypothetical protein
VTALLAPYRQPLSRDTSGFSSRAISARLTS